MINLSRSTWILLGGLLLANVIGFVVFVWQEPAVEPEVAIATDSSLRLLDELSGREREEMLRAVQDPDLSSERLSAIEAPAIAEPVLECRAWGPFGNISSVEPIREAVATIGEIIEVREALMAGDPDYLVLLSTDNNIENARRLLKELQSQSIDGYIIAGGAYVNSISIGVFSARARADRQLLQVADLGYEAQVQTLSRNMTVYYLLARIPAEIPQQVVANLRSGIQETFRSSVPCGEIEGR